MKRIFSLLVIIATYQQSALFAQATKNIHLVAGKETGSYCDFCAPLTSNIYPCYGVFADPAGNLLFTGGGHNICRINAIDPNNITMIAGGTWGTHLLSGDGGPATAAGVRVDAGIYVDAGNNIYSADCNNGDIRKIDYRTGNISHFAGIFFGGSIVDNVPATASDLEGPNDIIEDANGNILISDLKRIRKVASGKAACDGDALLFTAREFRGKMIEPMPQP